MYLKAWKKKKPTSIKSQHSKKLTTKVVKIFSLENKILQNKNANTTTTT